MRTAKEKMFKDTILDSERKHIGRDKNELPSKMLLRIEHTFERFSKTPLTLL